MLQNLQILITSYLNIQHQHRCETLAADSIVPAVSYQLNKIVNAKDRLQMLQLNNIIRDLVTA